MVRPLRSITLQCFSQHPEPGQCSTHGSPCTPRHTAQPMSNLASATFSPFRPKVPSVGQIRSLGLQRLLHALTGSVKGKVPLQMPLPRQRSCVCIAPDSLNLEPNLPQLARLCLPTFEAKKESSYPASGCRCCKKS